MTAPCPNPKCENGEVPGGEKGWLLCPDCGRLSETLHAVHRTLLTSARVKGELRPFEDPYHVVIVYTPSESLPALGAIVSASRPDREIADPIDVKVVEVIPYARVRGPEGNVAGMVVHLVVGEILPPAGLRSYPDTITSPIDPPTVDGTNIERPL